MDTREKIKAALEIMDEMNERAEKLIEMDLEAKGHRRFDLEDFKITSDYIEYRYDSSRCGCCTDIEYGSIDSDYLWDAEQYQERVEFLETEIKRKKAEEEEAELNRMIAAEERERAELRRLQSKFPNLK